MMKDSPEVQKQMEGYWKMLDDMNKENPAEYQKFIDKQMKEMKGEYAKDNEALLEEKKVQSAAYFSFSIKPAKMVDVNSKKKKDDGIKLFDAGEIKESFVDNEEKADPLGGLKIYLNVCFNDKMLPPLNKTKDFADPMNDNTWQIIPMAFSEPVKRKNLLGDVWTYDGHVNTCVVDRMKSSQAIFKAVLHHLILRFQFHLRDTLVLHKKSFKLVKKRLYKNGNGSKATIVPKFLIPDQFDKKRFAEVKQKLEKEVGMKQEKPKEVTLKGQPDSSD